jgi:leader peptidase (prepilin peptidase)/N-methyltransferase
MTLLPLWYQITAVFILGLIIGSFLNVLLYRFHTGKSINGNSHCLSCGTRLRWYELIPLFSYIALRGRCRNCGSAIPVRYFLVELLTAGSFLYIYLQLGWTVVAALVALLCTVLLFITVYDIYHMVIPNELVVVTAVVAIGYLLVLHDFSGIVDLLMPHSLAALGAFAFYGGLWVVSKGRWIGLGDAKLALPLGFLLGPMGTFSFVVLSFWVGAIVSIGILLWPRLERMCALICSAVHDVWRHCPQGSVVKYRRYLTIKSEVPFAPFMVIAFLLVFLGNVQVLAIMAALI